MAEQSGGQVGDDPALAAKVEVHRMAERPGDGSSDQDMESGPVEEPPLLVSPHRGEEQQSTEQQRSGDTGRQAQGVVTIEPTMYSTGPPLVSRHGGFVGPINVKGDVKETPLTEDRPQIGIIRRPDVFVKPDNEVRADDKVRRDDKVRLDNDVKPNDEVRQTAEISPDRRDDENKSIFKITLESNCKLRYSDRIRPNDDVGTDIEVTPDQEVRLDYINVGDEDRPNKPIKSVVNIDSEAGCVMQGDLFEAAQSGDVQTVKNYLDLGISSDLTDGQGWSILHHAASRGQVDMMRLLHSKGCSVNPRDRHGRTPLHHAASSGASASIGVLVEELGSEVNPVDEDGFTPLKRSVECEQYAVMKELLRCGGVVFSDEDLKAVFFQAAKTGDTQHVLAIRLESGRLIYAVDSNGCNALHWAAECGAAEMIPFLIKCGLDVNRGNNIGVKALHVAAQYGHQEVVSALLDAGCPIDVEDGNGYNVLHYAASGGAVEMILFLIEGEHCFDVNSEGKDGYTPLHEACDKSQSQAAFELLRHGAHLTKVAGRYGTPLHLAAIKEGASFIDDILEFEQLYSGFTSYPCNVYPESNNPVNVCDSFGRTPAFLAAGKGLIANLERLVANNCDITVRSNINFSIFESAIAGGRMSHLPAIANACRIAAGSASLKDLLHTLQAKDLLDPSKLLILGAIGEDPLVIDLLSSEQDMFTAAAHQVWSDTYCRMLLEINYSNDNKADAIYNCLCLPSACPLTPLQIAVIFMKYRTEYYKKFESQISKIVQTHAEFIQKLITHPVTMFTVNVQFPNGLSPLDVAQQFGLHDIADMIESAGGRPGMWVDLPKEAQFSPMTLFCSEYGIYLSSQGLTGLASLSRVIEGLVGVSPQLPATVARSVLVNQQTSADAVLHQKPTRNLLIKHVLPRVMMKQKWRTLCLLLDLEEEQVLKYRDDQGDDDPYQAVLFAWLEQGSQVSWEILFDAMGTFETNKSIEEMRAKVLLKLQLSAVTLDSALNSWLKQYQKVIQEQGSVSVQITRCVLIGPARVGKSSLKQLLVHNEPRLVPRHKSTDMMEAPVVLASMYHESEESVWKELTVDNLLQGLNKCTAEGEYNSGSPPRQPSPHNSPLHQPSTPTIYNSPPHQPSTPTIQEPHLDSGIIQSSGTVHRPLASELPSTVPEKDDCPDDLNSQLSRFVEQLRSVGYTNLKMNGLKLIHLFDCGGQLAFQDAIPCLIHAPSAFIVVFNASVHLEEEKEWTYCPHEGSKEVGRGHKESQWKILLRIFSSIHSLQYKCHADLKKLTQHEPSDQDEPSNSWPIVVVGTHKAILNSHCDKDFATINKCIESHFADLKSKLYCDLFLQGEPPDLVENKTLDDVPKINELRKQISEKTSFSLKLPLTWLYLELFTRTQHPKQLFISYKDLKALCLNGKLITNGDEEFNSLLRVLHALGFYAFFPLEDLGVSLDQNWVCTDAATLYREVSKLLMVQYTLDKPKTKAAAYLKSEGMIMLNEDSLQKLFNELKIGKINADSEIDRVFSPKWLILVVVYIGLAAKFKRGGIEQVFIPLALPFNECDLPPVTELSIATLCLTLEFPSGPSTGSVTPIPTDMPCGIFPRLVVLLLSEELKFDIFAKDSDRACVKLMPPESEADYRLYLKNCSSYVEVALQVNETVIDEDHEQEAAEKVYKICKFLRHTLTSSLEDAFFQLFGEQPLGKAVTARCGFKCTFCPASENDHLIVMGDLEPQSFSCVYKEGKCPLKSRNCSQRIWFCSVPAKFSVKTGTRCRIWVMDDSSSSACKRSPANTSPSVSKRQPPDSGAEESIPVLSDRDFLPYLDLMSSNILVLGVSLGIGDFTESVLNNPGSINFKCLQVVREWLRRTQEPTWSVFCEQLKGVQCFKHLVREIGRKHCTA